MVTAIYGASNLGKSTSIRFMARCLLNNPSYELRKAYYQDGFQEITGDQLQKAEQDILAIFEDKKNEKIILISSGGDTLRLIKKNLNMLNTTAKELWTDWDSIKKDSSKFLLITGVKYGQETDAANERGSFIDKFMKERAIWIHPPFIREKKHKECPEYQYVYKAFACGILAKYDERYKAIIDKI